METKMLSARVPVAVFDEVEREAKKRNDSKSAIVIEILEDWMVNR